MTGLLLWLPPAFEGKPCPHLGAGVSSEFQNCPVALPTFPLPEGKSTLHPGAGDFWIIFRIWGICPADLANSRNRQVRSTFTNAFAFWGQV